MFANIVVLQESPSDRFCALEILLLTYLLTYKSLSLSLDHKSLKIVKDFAFCKQSVMHDHVKSMLSRTSLCVLCFSSPVIFRLVDACVYGINWLLVSFLSHVNKNIIHSFIHSFIHKFGYHHRA